MLRSSFSLGRVLGVELRMHISFVLLLAVAVGYTMSTMDNAMRGFGLWAALLLAVVVREVARAIAAAYAGLKLRAVFLLPIGGVMALTSARGEVASEKRLVTLAGPLANAFTWAVMLGSCYAFQSGVHLFTQPWISARDLLKAFVWMQALMAVVGLLPAALPSKPLGTAKVAKLGGKLPVSFNAFAALALGLVLIGLLTVNPWLLGLGAFLFLGSQLTPSQQVANSPQAESIRVRDVMLTEYTLLSTSDTLISALERSVHSLQDVFPVVRGDQMVGSVTRGTLMESLQLQGESYLQGVMTRTLHIASPDEPLVEALRRGAALGASELIPVVEDGSLIGMLTPQSLSRSVQVVRTGRSD
jgi:CBS domain-containing protein